MQSLCFKFWLLLWCYLYFWYLLSPSETHHYMKHTMLMLTTLVHSRFLKSFFMFVSLLHWLAFAWSITSSYGNEIFNLFLCEKLFTNNLYSFTFLYNLTMHTTSLYYKKRKKKYINTKSIYYKLIIYNSVNLFVFICHYSLTACSSFSNFI